MKNTLTTQEILVNYLILDFHVELISDDFLRALAGQNSRSSLLLAFKTLTVFRLFQNRLKNYILLYAFVN